MKLEKMFGSNHSDDNFKCVGIMKYKVMTLNKALREGLRKGYFKIEKDENRDPKSVIVKYGGAEIFLKVDGWSRPKKKWMISW